MNDTKDVSAQIPVLAMPDMRAEAPRKNTPVSLPDAQEVLKFIAVGQEHKPPQGRNR